MKFLLFLVVLALVLSVAALGGLGERKKNMDRFDHSAIRVIRNALSGGMGAVQYTGPPQPLLVIGAGLPRTGTASLKTALEMLGLRCHHMMEVVETKGKIDFWHQHLVKKSIGFDKVLKDLANDGFNATVDMPAAFKYKEQMKQYPEAKIILSIRSEEGDKAATKWANSMVNTILNVPAMCRDVPFRWVAKVIQAAEYFEGSYGGVDLPMYEPEKLPAFYDAWNEDVLRTVNRENLLVFRAKDGWKPLCDFLGPVSEIVQANCLSFIASNEPYPRTNDTANILRAISNARMIIWVSKSMPAFLAVAIAWMMNRNRFARKKSD
ncbi:expressed unknown protein [Seminavis robusta]|uniref:Uncharacterized protein n=1 Tax=Seminavis robusta TaxID=568900 RepID=A0A9N8HJX3_9STRA|nr:expressed unknown protein [Seminavis robusta]|eukprot:Sro895_g217230.1 n/a (322) ;mRNA; r:33790-34755